MRVTGGRLKGRSIRGPTEAASRLRPIRSRVRQSLFDILAHGGHAAPPPPEGMHALDLFAGTGALGIEALSRGASRCSFVDSDAEARALIRSNLDALELTGFARVWRRDACSLARRPGAPYDLVFLDPPYGSGLAAPALHSAQANGWLAGHALAAVATGSGEDFDPPACWSPIARRDHGETRLFLIRGPAA